MESNAGINWKSIADIQRKLGVGYTVAARLQEMIDRGELIPMERLMTKKEMFDVFEQEFCISLRMADYTEGVIDCAKEQAYQKLVGKVAVKEDGVLTVEEMHTISQKMFNGVNDGDEELFQAIHSAMLQKRGGK